MQEEVEQKMVIVVEGVAKMTPRIFGKVLRAAVKLGKGTVKLGWKGVKLPFTLHKRSVSKLRHGKMTVKQLARNDHGITDIEVNDENIGSFKKIAKKYGIDFALKKVKDEDKFLVFFKGVDHDTMQLAYQEYMTKQAAKSTKRHERQSKRDARTQNKAQKKVQRKTRRRSRKRRPSLLGRLDAKKQEVSDRQRERQRAPQELSR